MDEGPVAERNSRNQIYVGRSLAARCVFALNKREQNVMYIPAVFLFFASKPGEGGNSLEIGVWRLREYGGELLRLGESQLARGWKMGSWWFLPAPWLDPRHSHGHSTPPTPAIISMVPNLLHMCEFTRGKILHRISIVGELTPLPSPKVPPPVCKASTEWRQSLRHGK